MMTETIGAVTAAADTNDDVSMASSPTPEELATARELVRAAQARGVSFADTADGVLKALTKTVVETALEEELSDHLAMTSTIRPGATGATPATEPARKPSSPTPWAKSKSRCPVIAPAASIRRSYASISGA
jgi:hypothetical protein